MLNFFIDLLATKRLTDLVVSDVITDPVRDRIFAKHPPHDRSIYYALSCKHCAGTWIALGVVAGRLCTPKLWGPLATALALSAGTSLVNKREDML